MRNPQTHSEQPMQAVAKASLLARRLVTREASSTGLPIKRVISAVARRLRQPHGSVWGLLFRKPKSVSHDLVVALEEAVEKEIRREIAALENELLAVRLGVARRTAVDLEEIASDLDRLKRRLDGEGA